MQKFLKENHLILMEAAMVERLRRMEGVELDPILVHASLIYVAPGIAALTQLYREYVEVAASQNLPILLCTPTWRGNQERVAKSDQPKSINRDAVRFLKQLRANQKEYSKGICVGGLISCKNDCYKPEEGLTAREAEAFHDWQVAELAAEKPDFLIAVTLPNTQEALGMAKALQKTGIPYIISFVINREGRILDGTPLADAISLIDQATARGPLGYMVNCSHPSFVKKADLAQAGERLIGIQANASSLDHSELNGSGALHSDDVGDWARQMMELHEQEGVRVLGGCCGTDSQHLRALFRFRRQGH